MLVAFPTNGIRERAYEVGVAMATATTAVNMRLAFEAGLPLVERPFDAWADEDWVNDGAAVRVSLVSFGHGEGARLDGREVPQIYADLTAPTEAGASTDTTHARSLAANASASFQGASKKAKFEIDAELARRWLSEPNPNGRPNSDVLKPWANGFELSRGPQHQWIIDFGIELSEADAALYQAPFEYVTQHVRPERERNNRESYRRYWWRFFSWLFWRDLLTPWRAAAEIGRASCRERVSSPV